MAARQSTKTDGGINALPLWARMLIPFVAIVGATIAYKYFEARSERTQDLEVARIAAEGEARGSSSGVERSGGALDRALAEAAKVDRSTDDLTRGSSRIKAMTSADLIGVWDEDDQSVTAEFGTIWFSEGVSIYKSDGTYRTSSLVTFRTKDGLLVDGEYRISVSGKYSVKAGRFLTTPLEGTARPSIPTGASSEKRSAMNMMAEEFRKPGEPDSDPIIEFSGDRFVIEARTDDGQVIRTVSRRR